MGDVVARRRSPVRRWLRIAFPVWAVVSTAWFLQSFRTRGVGDTLLASDAGVVVERDGRRLSYAPRRNVAPRGLLFLTGGGVAVEAYAPLLRPLAEEGHRVVILGLPYRLAPLEQHKQQAVAEARAILDGGQAESWVLAGHSLGAALACRVAAAAPERLAEVVLIATSHPRELDLSASPLRITKVFGTLDGVATPAMIEASRSRLPLSTRWVAVEGANHAQFGNYGRQLFDGSPTISRREQQAAARRVLRDALAAHQPPPG